MDARPGPDARGSAPRRQGPMTPPLGMAPFANQSRAEHAGVLLGGAAACLLGYAGGVSLLFGIDALGHGEPAGPRRIAAVFGSLACWGFYAGAFVRGKGGPVTDVVVYPVATVAVSRSRFGGPSSVRRGTRFETASVCWRSGRNCSSTPPFSFCRASRSPRACSRCGRVCSASRRSKTGSASTSRRPFGRRSSRSDRDGGSSLEADPQGVLFRGAESVP